MTARVWTVEELDRVHPLPKVDSERTLYPWAWRIDADGPVAYEVGPSESGEVWVDSWGHLASATEEPPADIALAVILASKGLDSTEAMASELHTWARRAKAVADASGEHASEHAEVACALESARDLVRRGTVHP